MVGSQGNAPLAVFPTVLKGAGFNLHRHPLGILVPQTGVGEAAHSRCSVGVEGFEPSTLGSFWGLGL